MRPAIGLLFLATVALATEHNVCVSEPCPSGEICFSGDDEYICVCSSQSGHLCFLEPHHRQTVTEGRTDSTSPASVTFCGASTCIYGECDQQDRCNCNPGYLGEFCHVESGLIACSSNPCLNGGSCVGFNGQYTCHCEAKNAGVNCEHVSSHASIHNSLGAVIYCLALAVALISLMGRLAKLETGASG